MKWLCIHGTGSSATIFQDQLAAVISHLDPSAHAFHFINGPIPCNPAAGLDLRYPDGPYYTWWTKATTAEIRAACQRLDDYLIDHNNNADPYDGVVCFSRGCLLLASYIWLHQTETPTKPLPFKSVIFICGGPVLSLLEELGMAIPEKARAWDQRTKLALRERASKDAILKHGKNRWTTPGANGDAELDFDPDSPAPIDPADVFGLDTAHMPPSLRIGIPTLHIYGRVDPRLPASLQLVYLSEAEGRMTFRHEGGHNVPRSEAAAERIARRIEEFAEGVVRRQSSY
ncbi:serine hydrolase FSH [Aspergillus egyptiacus]|nr:serine hydrolase FSH [Aspergillus egyptiacus]